MVITSLRHSNEPRENRNRYFPLSESEDSLIMNISFQKDLDCLGDIELTFSARFALYYYIILRGWFVNRIAARPN